MTYCPAEELHLGAQDWVAAVPTAVFAGCVGDIAHGCSGYHISANSLCLPDYSYQLSDDVNGIDSDASAAIDVSHTSYWMIEVTNRLRNSALNSKDTRLNGVREFAGTRDGITTYHYDIVNGYEEYGAWDDSHLYHVHLSILRKNVHNTDLMKRIVSVVKGETFEQWQAGGGTVPVLIPLEEETMRIVRHKLHPEQYVITERGVYQLKVADSQALLAAGFPYKEVAETEIPWAWFQANNRGVAAVDKVTHQIQQWGNYPS